MPHPPEPTGLIQVVAFQILTRLRAVAGSVRIALFQLAMCLLLFFTYAIPDQANDIFVALSSGEMFQFTGLIFSLLLISYINWYMVRYVYVKLLEYNRLPDHYSENFYRKVLEPFVTVFPFFAAALGFYFSVKTINSWSCIILILSIGVAWYLVLFSLSKRGITASLKEIMRTERPELPGSNWYVIIVTVFVLFFASLVLIPQHTGWTKLFGPIVTISLGFCFWTWLGSYVYLFSRLWFTPFIPIALTYVFFVAEPFNNNHSVRTLEFNVAGRPTVEAFIKQWIKTKYKNWNPNSTGNQNVFMVSAEGGGIRSAYWTSGVLAWLEENSGFGLHKRIISMSGVSGGSVGIGFFTAGINAVEQEKFTELRDRLRKTASQDFLSDLNAGLIFFDFIQKGIPLPVKHFDRARKLEDAFSNSFTHFFNNKNSLDFGLCAEYSENKKYFNPLLIFNTTHVESGRKAIVSNCRIDENKKYFHDVIDVLQKAQQDVPLKCAVSMSARFPFVTPPALIDSIGGKPWGHVVDGGYFENSGLHSTWQTYLVLQKVIKQELNSNDTLYKKFLNQLKVHVIYIKNSYTDPEEDKTPLKLEELAPASAFVNAWGRKTITDIKHFENNVDSTCFHFIELRRGPDDGIPLGWYLSNDACLKMQNQLDSLKFTEPVKKLVNVLDNSKQ
jgi:predicted acylesterase/phospholipase RssA/heme/copper-type cytochrome/quinol oxidase subunit 2